MNKFSRLVLIGTALATFVGLAVLAEKLGGTIFFYVGIALFVAFAKRRRAARQGQDGSQKGQPSGSGCKSVPAGEVGQAQQSSA